MPTGKSILRFVAALCCFYAIFIALWPVVGARYAASFRSICTIAFHTFGSDGVVHFAPLADSAAANTSNPTSPFGAEFDCRLQIRNTRTGAGLSQPLSSRMLGYVPTIVVLSLVLATMATNRRQWKSLLIALVMIHVFIALRLTLNLLVAFSGDDPVAQFRFGAVAYGTATFLNDLLTRSLTMNYVAPLLLWMVLAFRSRAQAAAIK